MSEQTEDQTERSQFIPNVKVTSESNRTIERIPPLPSPEAKTWTQITSVLGISYGCFVHGTTVVFPAVFIPSITKANASKSLKDNVTKSQFEYQNESRNSFYLSGEIPFTISSDDISLIVSIAAFGMLFSSLVAGSVSNLIGRKQTSIFGTWLSFAASFALIPFAQYIWMFYLGRFLMGVGLGFSTTVSTVYIMEISTPNLRAGLAVIPAVAGTLGVLACQCLGAVLNWQWLSITLFALNIPFLFIVLALVPETPFYLISKEQIEKAHKVLRQVRGKSWDITAELTDIKVSIEEGDKAKQSDDQKFKLRYFGEAAVVKAFCTALALMFFFQFTGINIALQYTVEIFKAAKSSVEEFMATIFVGIALLVSNTLTLAIANKTPRRLMLLLSAAGISLCLFTMGAYFHIASDKCREGADDCVLVVDDSWLEKLGWMPVTVLMLYIFMFNLGYGAMIWITVVEILPVRVRSVSNSLCVAFTCLCSFLTSYTYNGIVEALEIEWVFWFYGGVSILGLIFIYIFVPETKNKSEAEMKENFKGEKKN